MDFLVLGINLCRMHERMSMRSALNLIEWEKMQGEKKSATSASGSGGIERKGVSTRYRPVGIRRRCGRREGTCHLDCDALERFPELFGGESDLIAQVECSSSVRPLGHGSYASAYLFIEDLPRCDWCPDEHEQEGPEAGDGDATMLRNGRVSVAGGARCPQLRIVQDPHLRV